MIARFGGDSIRCADYALFGTAELSATAMTALRDRSGCLLANHGMVTFASDLSGVLARAIELEALCEQYWRARQLGAPVLLTPQEMDAALAQFAGYGHQPQVMKNSS
jgi:L-fuculose-phosphate aldolase